MNDEEPAVTDWRAAFEERQKKLDELEELFDEGERIVQKLVNEYFNK